MMPGCIIFSELRYWLLLPIFLWPKTFAVWGAVIFLQPDLVLHLPSFVISWSVAVGLVHVITFFFQTYSRTYHSQEIRIPESNRQWSQQCIYNKNNHITSTKESLHTPSNASNTANEYAAAAQAASRAVPSSCHPPVGTSYGVKFSGLLRHQANACLDWNSFSDDEDDDEDESRYRTWEDGSVFSDDLSWSDLQSDGNLEKIVILWPRSSQFGEVRERLPSTLDLSSLYHFDDNDS